MCSYRPQLEEQQSPAIAGQDGVSVSSRDENGLVDHGGSDSPFGTPERSENAER